MIAKTRAISDVLNMTTSLPTIHFTNPKKVYVSITNARCKSAEVYVKPGDKVKIGTIIGKRDGGFFEQNMHSTVSGTVLGTVKKWHRTGKMIEFIEIENDFLDEYEQTIYERSDEEVNNYTRDDIIERVKNNAVIGLGGSTFPSYVKLQGCKNIDTLIINGVECEPYLTTDHRVMLEYPNKIMEGIGYLLKATGAKKAYLCFKKKYDDLYQVLSAVRKRHMDLPIEVKRVENLYPQGWEIALIKSVTGKTIPHGELPQNHGVIVFNASTALGIYRAVRLNMPVIERNFTLTGDGVKYPSNIRMRIGTPLQDLLEICGGYVDETDKVLIMGGPMMGACLLKDDAVCSMSCTSAIILQAKNYKEEPCIRCASCVYSCPCGLQPVLIMKAVKTKDIDALKKLNVKSCIECGMCGYTCTSKINLTDYMRQAKKLIK